MIFILAVVRADLPVHCLRSDFAGAWDLQLSASVPKGHSTDEVPDFGKAEEFSKEYCFSGHPNRNTHNLKLDLPKRMKVEQAADLTLTLDRTSGDRLEHLVADVDGAAGTWTTVYDEGWEARVPSEAGETRYFALAKYVCAEDDAHCYKDGVGESSVGTTKGFSSHCGQVLVGWYTRGGEMGCFYGQKKEGGEAVHSYVVEQQQAHHSSLITVHTAYHASEFFTFPEYSAIEKLHHDGAHAENFTTVRRPGSIRRFKQSTLRLRDECAADEVLQKGAVEDLEKKHPVFDWRDFAENKWNTEPMDQGSCGSCYAIALAYVLQARANIAVFKEAIKLGKPTPSKPVAVLSSSAILGCSYYNQGCSGGYPYLAAKHTVDFGLPSEACYPYSDTAGEDGHDCKAECMREDQSVYAKDYNYVGGFYGACGEQRIMQSLLTGPVVVAIEVPSPFAGAGGGKIVGESYLNLRRTATVAADGAIEREARAPEAHHRQDPPAASRLLEAKWVLKDGCSAHGSIDAAMWSAFPGAFVPRESGWFALDSDQLHVGVRPYETAKKTLARALQVREDCVDLRMADGTPNGWEYTNHAIVVVGWGQHEKDEEQQKYWIVRNSWGSFYGDGGYAYVARGVDYAGIESQAVDLTVDLERGAMKRYMDDLRA